MHEKLPETVYHYTDIYGVQGIYESEELWATSSRFLNDSTEATPGIDSLKTRILNKKVELLTAQSELMEAANQVPRLLSGSEEESLADLREKTKKLKPVLDAVDDIEKFIDCFIVSLSEVPDQLSQWRGYAREGYCIGFSTEKLCEALGKDYVLRKVVYAGEEGSTGYIDQITGIAMALAESETVTDEDHRRWSLRSAIRFESAFVKNSTFNEEKELRIVPFSVESPNHFTAGRYGLTPRHKIKIARDAITEVCVGPGAHVDLRARSLVEYFHFTRDQFPITSTPTVKRSSVPYRDW
ncbi:DUF2971 domain-containing protein [Rhodococcus qingshengii]|uniref:DUF2971 domain-containing protein n=1 Tax=Rhodococcus qingshengii TaxID=334542 RepID=UPI00195CF016|nr:DUF2971 domain-containing protein [Rhodococcus qingshengii]QXC45213.1 DUF2971 domain-containing protein [Rhodococcus qingshengii]